MKALIAAGGRATRLRPITWTINKHLIPLANKPMLAHVIEKIVEAGITDIIVNVNEGEKDIMANALGDGSAYGATLTYVEQKGGAKGVAHVVSNAKEYLEGEKFLFFLGDNIILGSIKKFVDRFVNEDLDCMLAFSKVEDPQRFGVPEFDAEGKLVRVLEKPENPPSDFAVTGIYLYNEDYFEAFDSIEPSARGEYEISDINSWYVTNRNVGYEEITGWWKDTGTPIALVEGNALILKDTDAGEFSIEGETEGVHIEGNVSIGKGSKVIGGSIKGPVVIGENCVIEDAVIGPYTSIGFGTKIKDTQLEHSIVFTGVTIDGTRPIVNSLIGKDATLVNVEKSEPKEGHHLVVGDNSFIEL